jgi:hypothetical protein
MNSQKTASGIIDTGTIQESKVNREELKKILLDILLEDPDSDLKSLALGFLSECIKDAMKDPEKNPVIEKFFNSKLQEIEDNYRILLEEIKQEFRARIDRLENLISEDRDYYAQDLDELFYRTGGRSNLYKDDEARICKDYWRY